MALHILRTLRTGTRSYYNSLRSDRTFRVICYCGLAGVLVDIDHAIAWITNYARGTDLPARFLHTPLLVASGLVIIGVCAYLAGLYATLVLKRRRRTMKSLGRQDNASD